MDITLTVSKKLAEEIARWAREEQQFWPRLTDYQEQLKNLLEQIETAARSGDTPEPCR